MKTLFLLFALLPTFCFSQNYQTVQPGTTAYFQPDSNFIPVIYPYLVYEHPDNAWIMALQVEEQTSSNDYSVYTNFSELNNEAYSLNGWWSECFYDDLDSWIGKSLILFDDGLNVFLNRDGDSIFINTSAVNGDAFKFYIYDDDSYFLATVMNMETLNFLGLSDMAKTYELQYYTADNQPAYSIHNGKQFIITENYGFYRCLNFRDFPDFGDNTYPAVELVLAGLSDPLTGFKNLTYGDIFDFEVGDIFHYHETASGFGGGYNQYRINTVLGKEEPNLDTLRYQIESLWWRYAPEGYTWGLDTLQKLYAKLNQYIAEDLPYEVGIEYGIFDTIASYHLATTNGFNNRPQILTPDAGFVWNEPDGCYQLPMETYSWYFEKYIAGCGSLGYYESDDGSGTVTSSANLEYFKKGDEEWGTPLIPPTIGIHENDLSASINIFPNPATDKISIVTDKQQKIKAITIFDPTGQIILQKKAPVSTIDISILQAGLYFVEVELENGNVRRKLIVE